MPVERARCVVVSETRNRTNKARECMMFYKTWDEKDIKSLGHDPDWTMFAFRAHGGQCIDSETFEVLVGKLKKANRLSVGRRHVAPRYVTLITLIDEDGFALAGGCSVCGHSDEPVRSIGYAIAMDMLNKRLDQDGLEFSRKSR